MPIFKTIEISIVKLPEKEEVKILKPKVAKRKVIGAIKKRPKLIPRKTPTTIKKPTLPPKPKVVPEVKEVITPTTLPTIAGGLEKDEAHGKIHIAKAIPNEGISQAEERKTSQAGLTAQLDVTAEEGKEESTGPYIYISGPASKRKALYQPTFKPPYWLERRGQSVHGKLKIWVLPDGSVDKVEIEESFGYAEIDRLARTAIYKWRFYKLPPNIKRVDWGIVTITIRLE
jgi:TonB family protein